MPKISLVVCLYKERDLLERLLHHAEGCYDDLVVVHDGPEAGDPDWKPGPPSLELAIDWACVPPDAPLPVVFQKCQSVAKPGSLREFVEKKGWRFFEHPRVGSLEGQSPFAWWAAKHDWILRLDADEFPSEEMKIWLKDFRIAPDPPEDSSGFSCIWPLWKGKSLHSSKWPSGRLFLFNKNAVSFFGLVEQSPILENKAFGLQILLHHQPHRKSYGIRNIIFRKQAYIWRSVIANSLLDSPLSLPRWRWSSASWPSGWTSIIEAPLFEGIYRLVKFPFQQASSMRAAGIFPSPSICLNPALHHFLLCMKLWSLQRYALSMSKPRRFIKKAILFLIYRAIAGKRPDLETLGKTCPWTLNVSKINSTSNVLSGGVGGDISFELELAARTGCTIALFDPSPTGLQTISSLSPLPNSVAFFPFALSAKSGTTHFAHPFDSQEGSYRQPVPGEEGGGEWKAISIPDFMKQKGWKALDILKLDIEGFEFEVLDSILKAGLPCKQLLVEFHYGKSMGHSFWKFLSFLIKLRLAGFRLVHHFKSDFSFMHQDSSIGCCANSGASSQHQTHP